MVSFDLRSPPSARSNGRNRRSPLWTHTKGGSQLGKMVWPYAWSTAAVAIAAGLGLVLTAQVPLPNVSMVFLLAVLFSAARFGIWPALFSSGLSFLAYNYLFIPPRQSFSVAEPHELLALLVL